MVGVDLSWVCEIGLPAGGDERGKPSIIGSSGRGERDSRVATLGGGAGVSKRRIATCTYLRALGEQEGRELKKGSLAALLRKGASLSTQEQNQSPQTAATATTSDNLRFYGEQPSKYRHKIHCTRTHRKKAR